MNLRKIASVIATGVLLVACGTANPDEDASTTTTLPELTTTTASDLTSTTGWRFLAAVEALRKQRAQQLADRLAAGERWQETRPVLAAHQPKPGFEYVGDRVRQFLRHVVGRFEVDEGPGLWLTGRPRLRHPG